MERSRILVVSDELAVVQECTRTIARMGHVVDSALSVLEARSKLDKNDYDVVFYDLKLSTKGGLELLALMQESHPTSSIVILHGTAPLFAAQTLGSGVYEYLSKPFTVDAIQVTLGRALAQRAMVISAKNLDNHGELSEFGELVGNGPAMRSIFRLIHKVAPTGSTALIIGKPGTGKILAAQAIHRISSRRSEPFVMLETGIKRGEELSALLFGRMEFRAGREHIVPGYITEAGGGTLYLDEITALDAWGQAQMVEVTRRRRYHPWAGGEYQNAACRFIWGTKRDLKAVAEQGELIAELLNEVVVYPIYLPSLAERIEDVPELTYQFLRRFAKRFDKPVIRFDDRLLTRLIARPWPGNARELGHCIERMVVISDGPALTMDHYQRVMEGGGFSHWDGRIPRNVKELKEVKNKLRRVAVAEVERAFITGALQRCQGNVTRAAQEVGMQRRNFQTLMREFGIKAG
ncbi:MAG: sigma-54 dependent transcriptional regulator [Calditrichota bacterium]